MLGMKKKVMAWQKFNLEVKLQLFFNIKNLKLKKFFLIYREIQRNHKIKKIILFLMHNHEIVIYRK